MTISIGVLGAAGRMGQAIIASADAAGVTVKGGVDRVGAITGSFADAASLAAQVDVLVDFSSPAALAAHLAVATDAETPLLIGTTGLGDAHHAAIDQAAAHVAILQTANTSLGVNVLRGLVEQAARVLGTDWDIEIVEMHHRHKLDSPSGTALLLGESANIGREAASATALNRFDRMREGAHEREEGGVYYASLRGGSVAGDHQVIFAGGGERIELGHRAESRAIFAKGALRGAIWLAGKPAGRYTMADALGFA
jgi:4-hydroxy-tetrahydrodipicolinate reductase